MQGVTARLDDEVYCSPGVTPGLCTRLRLRRKLVNGVHRQHYARDPRNATLVDRWNVVPEIVVVHSIDLPVHLIWPRAVERTKTTDRISAVTRRDGHQLSKVSAIQRQVLDDV